MGLRYSCWNKSRLGYFLLCDILHIAVPLSVGAHLLLRPVIIRHDVLGIERLRFSDTFRPPHTLCSMFEHRLIWSLSKLQLRSFNDATPTYLPPSSSITPRLLDSRLHDFRKSTQAGFDILLTAYDSCIAIRDTRCFLYFVSLIL
jgi:hypothetical protein